MEGNASCKALVFTAKDVIEYKDISMPKLESSEDAILKVLACGICGSDLHPLHGKEECATDTAFGHECVGEIIKLGEKVTGFEVGQKCIVPFTVACGKCFYCQRNLSARCSFSQLLGWKDPETKEGLHGGQSEYVRIPLASGSLYELPLHFSLEEGLLLGDIASTAAYCAANAQLCGTSSGNSVSDLISLIERKMTSTGIENDCNSSETPLLYTVIGCGPVGLLTIAMTRCILHLRGIVSPIIFAVDAVDARLEFAQQWGAIPLKIDLGKNSNENVSLDSMPSISQVDLKKQMKKESKLLNRSGEGVDVCLECVGAPSALDLAYDILAPGGILSSIGVHSGTFPFTPSDAYDKNITYRTGRCPARSLMKPAEFLLQYAKDTLNINMVDIVTHKFPLSDGKRAYEIFDNKLDGCLKPILYP